MCRNFLKLNDSKTEFIIFGTPQNLENVSGWTVTVGDNEILPSACARNIGAYMDSALKMTTHVNNTIRACYAQLNAIAKIRRYLTLEAAKKLVHAFVSSRLDNLNSLLINIPDFRLKRLQMILNNAARIVAMQKRSDHIMPILIELHWLPVQCRIEYKIILLVFKCIIEKAPSYLRSLIITHNPSRALRSASLELLHQPKCHRKFGERAFAVCGPRLWNCLPLSLRKCKSINSFKTLLKTNLFRKAYNLNE